MSQRERRRRSPVWFTSPNMFSSSVQVSVNGRNTLLHCQNFAFEVFFETSRGESDSSSVVKRIRLGFPFRDFRQAILRKSISFPLPRRRASRKIRLMTRRRRQSIRQRDQPLLDRCCVLQRRESISLGVLETLGNPASNATSSGCWAGELFPIRENHTRV